MSARTCPLLRTALLARLSNMESEIADDLFGSKLAILITKCTCRNGRVSCILRQARRVPEQSRSVQIRLRRVTRC